MEIHWSSIKSAIPRAGKMVIEEEEKEVKEFVKKRYSEKRSSQLHASAQTFRILPSLQRLS
jgi:hypothetical protein